MREFGSARYSSIPRGVANIVQQQRAPVEGGENPAVTVFRRPVRSQVGSLREIDTSLGLEDEARCIHPGSFEVTSRIQTEFAQPKPVPETDNWVDGLRMFATRRCDHEGDRGEGNTS